jgi:hypothetical protein
VEFFVVGERIGSAVAVPYSLRWVAQAGEHTITARATDHAGNVGESEAVQIVVTR